MGVQGMAMLKLCDSPCLQKIHSQSYIFCMLLVYLYGDCLVSNYFVKFISGLRISIEVL